MRSIGYKVHQTGDVTTITFDNPLHNWSEDETLKPNDLLRIYSLNPGTDLLKHLLRLILSDSEGIMGIEEFTMRRNSLELKGNINPDHAATLAYEALRLASS